MKADTRFFDIPEGRRKAFCDVNENNRVKVPNESAEGYAKNEGVLENRERAIKRR